MQPLPIDPLLPELERTLLGAPNVVLEAPPGAGKTTRVPRAILDAGLAGEREIVVLEPRRLAARLAARRVAEELGEEVGGTVGYTVRFEDASSSRTRIRFVTEGVLTRRLLSDPGLPRVSVVLLDEFHERHLHGDVALATLRRMQLTTRPDLRLVVMSATLEASPIARFLGDAPVLRAEGRRFEVALEHLERSPDRPLESLVASAVKRLCDEGLLGDVLVFLPGSAEIRRAARACEAVARSEDLLVLPLHGSMPPAEQDRAIRPADRRKVILATNVAETSVTIDGVVAVIDGGLARIAAHAPWSGLPTLRVAKISRSSATQRAGRAGRTRPGRCLRLYTKGDLAARPEHDAPEIARLDLAETALELHAGGVAELASFGWFEAPPAASLAAAEALLLRLGAIEARPEAGCVITTTGRRMLRFPVHPRLSRMIVEAERRGVAAEGCALAALAAERDIRAEGGASRRDVRGGSDLIARLDELEEAERGSASFERVRAMGLDPGRVDAAVRVRKALVRLADLRAGRRPAGAERFDAELRITILAGYPDRVGRLRRPANATGRAGLEIVFAGGGTASLAESSAVADADLVVAIDAEERTEGRRARTVVRLASAIEADWLLELFTDTVTDTSELVWNEAAQRVEARRLLAYEGLVLEETRAPAPPGPETSAVLVAAARAKGWRAFVDDDALDRFRTRVDFARAHCPELGFPAMDDAGVADALASIADGRRSFAELRAADLSSAIRGRLGREQTRALEEIAPDRIALPGGRQVRVEYGEGGPRVASRLQDFFGMARGPTLARGRVPAVLELLAPNQRAVQVTTDLEGFWAKHYPGIARELRRRYPRHSWPDDPRSAAPPPPRPPRRR